MFKKVVSLLLVVVMCLSVSVVLGSCKKDTQSYYDQIMEAANAVEKTEKAKGIYDDAAFAAFDKTALTDDQKAAMKVGIICLHDENSTYDLNFINAAKQAAQELGLAESQLLFKKGIEESAACREACDELATAGCTVIFADSFGHESYVLDAAKAYPNIQFCHATGTQAHTSNQANFHNAFASIYEGRYVAGIVAGLKLNEMIAAGTFKAEDAKIGYVGAFPYAEVKSGYTSFYLGAKSVCPTVTMEVTFTNSWYDEAAEKTGAETLIARGCKLISQHADSMGAPTACETANVPNVAYNGSTTSACPKTALISSRIDWTPYFKYMILCVANNIAIANDFCCGFASGSVKLTELNTAAAAAGTQAKIDEAVAAFKAGTLKVFDVEKDNFITIEGKKLTAYVADVDDMGDYKGETHVIWNGQFEESYFRSAPYFDVNIDGITLLVED